jgi:acyl dehydratase
MSETASDEAAAKSGYGILTDEGIERLRQRIGIQVGKPTPPHCFEVTFDNTRRFANGYGDNNPLWCDPDYGKTTRWGGLIGPPNFLYCMGEQDAPELTPAQKAVMKGDPLVGLGSYQAEMSFEWWRPLRRNDRLWQRSALVGVTVNDHSSFGGRTVTETKGFIYRNQDDELTAIQRGSWIRAERHASKERKKAYDLPKPYGDEELARIDAAYAAETLRGAETLYFEDVKVGEDIPTIVRGPLRTSDIIVWHVGVGMGITPPGNFRESWKIRHKVPGMFTPNALGIPDTVQRLHWEAAWANELGIPIPYDYGAMRETFLTNIVTNWMGDEGWLWKLSCQHRKFVYTGDTYWIKGRVASKTKEAGRNEVHLDVWVENQWGAIVTPGSAVVLLPTRDAPVELPKPADEDIDKMYAHEVATLAQRR